MSHIPFHPAIGFGDLLPGEFVVPQNPIRDAGTPLVPSTVAVMGGKPYRTPHLADLLPGKFVVPQNPLITTVTNGYSGIPQHSHAGCGCGGACGGGKGMGDLSDVGTWLTSNTVVSAVPNWVIVAGAGVAAWMLFMPSGSDYRRKSAALRSQYRGYRRASRAAGSTLQDV